MTPHKFAFGRRAVLVVLALATWTVWATAPTAATPPIPPASLLEHIKVLAADDMKGRASGTPELERAAEYIAQQFDSAGLSPAAGQAGWFQPFELDAGLTVGEGNTLALSAGSRTATLSLGVSYYPLAAAGNTDAGEASLRLTDVPIVFAGYGISAPGVRYDDYEAVNVSGKAVLVFSHEPQELSRTSRLNGNQPIPESSLAAKAAAARARGAVALLVVSDPAHSADTASYESFTELPDADNLGIPVLRVRRDSIAALLFAWDLDRTARFIDDDVRPRSRELPDARLQYTEFLTRNRRTVRNVVGALPGHGPLARETVVIGAHYDHVGLGGRYSVVPDRTGEVHNGADDNASGTASIIEIARAAAADRARFPRTLLFVAFAGEERGLLGSSYYTSHALAPIDATVAMLNLDMVGRLRGAVDVSGIDSAPSLLPELRAAARATGNIRYRQEGPGAGRSDDYPFLNAHVPAINFFTGFHADYHHPSDDWQRINAEGTARVARLALELAARIAARPERPEFTPQLR